MLYFKRIIFRRERGETRGFMMLRKRAALLLFAPAFLLSFLVSCAQNAVVFSFGSQSVTKRLFSYALTLSKTQTLATLSGSAAEMEDRPEIWETPAADGKPLGDLVREQTEKSVSLMLFYADYAAQKGISLSAEERAAVTAQVDEIVAHFDSESAFRRYMAAYDIDYDLLVRYYELDALCAAGMRAYYAAAPTSLTEADVRDYYRQNYVTCLFVFYDLTDRLLENGKTVPLTEAQKAQKQAQIEAARSALLEGAPLSDFLAESDESTFSDGVPQTFSRADLASDALFDALFALADGESAELYADGGLYLMQKEALSDAYYEENLSGALLYAVKDLRERAILEENAAAFWRDDDALASFSVAALPVFS